MTKRKILLAVILAVAVACVAGVGVWAIDAMQSPKPDVPNVGKELAAEVNLPETEAKAVADATDEPVKTETEPETTAETEADVVPAVTVAANPVAVESSETESSSVYDPPFEKEPGPDNSPEAQLARQKEKIAEGQAETIRLNQQYQTMQAQRAEFLASAGGNEAELTSAQSAELASMDAAIETFRRSCSVLLENPDFYDYDVFFLRNTNDFIAQYEWEVQMLEEGSWDYINSSLKLEMFEKMLEMYEDGTDIDSIYLYYFERKDEIIHDVTAIYYGDNN